MPPPNPARPTAAVRPGATPTPTHPGGTGTGGAAGANAADETTGYPAGAAGGAGAAGAQGATAGQPDYAPLGNVEPGDVWQLAFWAVTQAADDTESANRRAVVREILMRLVDAIAWEDEQSSGAARRPAHRR